MQHPEMLGTVHCVARDAGHACGRLNSVKPARGRPSSKTCPPLPRAPPARHGTAPVRFGPRAGLDAACAAAPVRGVVVEGGAGLQTLAVVGDVMLCGGGRGRGSYSMNQ